MRHEPTGPLVALVATGLVVCCAAPVLVSAAAAAGVVAWLTGGGLLLAVGAVTMTSLVLVWARRRRCGTRAG